MIYEEVEGLTFAKIIVFGDLPMVLIYKKGSGVV